MVVPAVTGLTFTDLPSLLSERAATRADDLVYTDRAAGETWGALDQRARGIAAALLEDGLATQERVVYIGKNSGDYLAVLFGCALAGLIFVPLNWRLSPIEIKALVVDAKARVVIVDVEQVEALAPAAGPLGAVARLVSTGSDAPTGWTVLGGWTSGRSTARREPLANDIAFQLYTSGTTGVPKGAMFANGTNVRALLNDMSRAWHFTPNDISMVAMPMFHMGGLAWVLASLAGGARLVLVRDFVPAAVVDALEAEQVTATFFVPTMIQALLAVPGLADRPLALQRLVYSGSAIAPSILRQAIDAFHCDFVQIYGLTEATGAFAQLDGHEHDPGGPREYLLKSSGRVYPWAEVRAVDTTTLEEVPAGQPGEIWTRSHQTMVGYFNRPEETAAAISEEGWLRTGDIGRIDEEGYIFLLDRFKDMIISGGENVYPVEVEGVLLGHPDIAEAAVIGVPSDRWGETVKALVVPRLGREIEESEIIAFARAQLAAFKCPTSVEVSAPFPRTATGKIRKNLVREPYWAGKDRRIN